MSIKALDFVKAMIILIFGIIIIGAIIEGEFGISDAATKIAFPAVMHSARVKEFSF